MAFRDDLGEHLLVKTTAVLGAQRGDVQRAGSNPLEQTGEALHSGSRGRRALGVRGRRSHVENPISQMGCDESQAVSTLAKHMQAVMLLVRFLKGSLRCLIVHGRQAEQPVVNISSDGDRAECAKIRRWTASSCVMLAGHLIASSAGTRSVVATSSGEAEIHALTKSGGGNGC